MKVILLSELKGKGGEGDVIEVADGFANNYLLPQGIAIKATKGNLKQLKQRMHNIAIREEDRIAQALKNKEILQNSTIKIQVRVGEEGVLFGSVTAQMISDAIAEQTGITIDRRKIDLKHAIKTAGEHQVVISLYRDIKADLTILVGDAEMLADKEEVIETLEIESEEIIVEVEASE